MLPEILDEAIRKVELERLQSVVRQACQESTVARELFEAHLLYAPSTKPAVKRKRGLDEDKSEDLQAQPKKSTKKQRKYLRFAKCDHCGQEYDALDNDEESCEWHEGELECDYDHAAWGLWDTEWGPIDSEENQEAFPERFKWSCCGEDGTIDGCKYGKHVPDMYFKDCVSEHAPQIGKNKRTEQLAAARESRRRTLPTESDIWLTLTTPRT